MTVEAAPESAPLTARELELLALAAEGRPRREIAEALVVSPHTVTSHHRNAVRKLGARNMPNAVYLAFERGLLR